MVANHFRWDFIGLSTDSKPTADNPRVADGSTYYESDTSKVFVWYKDRWYEKTATGGETTPMVILTATEYEQLDPKDEGTLYFIKADSEE